MKEKKRSSILIFALLTIVVCSNVKASENAEKKFLETNGVKVYENEPKKLKRVKLFARAKEHNKVVDLAEAAIKSKDCTTELLKKEQTINKLKRQISTEKTSNNSLKESNKFLALELALANEQLKNLQSKQNRKEEEE